MLARLTQMVRNCNKILPVKTVVSTEKFSGFICYCNRNRIYCCIWALHPNLI